VSEFYTVGSSEQALKTAESNSGRREYLITNPFESVFEQHLSPEQQELRTSHLRELQKLLKDNSSFTHEQLVSIMTQAKCLWPLLNPGLKTDLGDWSDHPIRFKSKQKINLDFIESNWQHSVEMITAFYELKKIAPTIIATLDEATIIKMIINHDVSEAVYGDVDAKDQINSSSKKHKQVQEKTAIQLIGGLVSGIDDPVALHEAYASRLDIHSHLTKALDQRSGDVSFYINIIQWLHQHPDGESIYLQHRHELENNFAPNNANRFTHYGNFFQQLADHLHVQEIQLDHPTTTDQLAGTYQFFMSATTQQIDSFSMLQSQS
jgi:hypothetical protein